MDSVELLADAMAAARRIGFEVREEWFGGSGGGGCQIRGQKYLFLDLSLSPRDRLARRFMHSTPTAKSSSSSCRRRFGGCWQCAAWPKPHRRRIQPTSLGRW